jgi:hypothetical protein
MSRTISRSRLAVALMLIGLLTACAEDSSPPAAAIPVNQSSAPAPDSSSPSPQASATAVTGDNAQRQALDTYLGMQTAFAQAGRDGNPNNPALSKYATGAAFDLLSSALRNRAQQGILARGETVHHPEITEMSPAYAPTRATVRDCMDTRNSSLYKPDGTPVQQDKGGFRLAVSDLERTAGAWRVTTLAIRETGTCSP